MFQPLTDCPPRLSGELPGHKAFQTILKNRVNHGGILAPGAGRIKYGEGGRGIKSRWYPKTLYKRIMKIAAMRERLTFVEGDGFEVIRQHAQRADTVFFIDPPYTAGSKKAGKRLYTHSEIDHAELFQIVNSVRGDFLMTYDNDAAVQRLADEHGFDTEPIAMKNTHHAKMTELVIGRDLAWMRV